MDVSSLSSLSCSALLCLGLLESTNGWWRNGRKSLQVLSALTSRYGIV